MVGVAVSYRLTRGGDHRGQIPVAVRVSDRLRDGADLLALASDTPRRIVSPRKRVVGIGSSGQSTDAIGACIVSEINGLIRVRNLGDAIQRVVTFRESLRHLSLQADTKTHTSRYENPHKKSGLFLENSIFFGKQIDE